MDYLGAATRLPGRRPSLDERLGLRPACGPAASRMGLVGLASLACLDVCVPKGRRFFQRRATPWMQKPFTAPPFFPLRSFGPTGQPFSGNVASDRQGLRASPTGIASCGQEGRSRSFPP
jgi:hypothetical protein